MTAGDQEPVLHELDEHLDRRATTMTAAIAHLALVTAAGFAVVALPLAWVGWFRWFAVLPSTALIAAGLYLADRRTPFVIRSGTWPTVVMLVGVGLATMLNLAHPTQFFSAGRDPGVYAVTGLWLEREGTILFDAPPTEIEGVEGVVGTGAGLYPRADGRFEPQFPHLTHTMLGAAAMVGDTAALTRANAVVGAGALVVLFLLIQQLAPGWAAAASTWVIAFALPQMYFSRGSFSEPLAQLLLLGGVAILTSGADLSRCHALLSGMLLGAVIGSRVDAILVLSALVIVVTAWLLDSSRARRSSLPWLAVGLSVTGGIAVFDLRWFSSGYLASLGGELRMATLLAVATALLATAVLGWRGPITRAVEPLRSGTNRMGMAAALAVWGLALWVLFVRPLIPSHRSSPESPVSLAIGALQARQGLPHEPTRTYSEQAGEWMAWYLGWPLVLIAVLGAAVLVHRLFVRWSWPHFAGVALLAVPTALYLWRPSITPDHLFAMRRFVPTTLPLLGLLGAIGMAEIRRWITASHGRRGPALPVLLGSLVVVPAMTVSLPFWTFREFRMDTASLAELCEAFDDSPVLIDQAGGMAREYIPAFTAVCEVDAALVDRRYWASVPVLAERYRESDQDLTLVSQRSDLSEVIDGLELVDSIDFRVEEIERAVARVPIGSDPSPGATTLHLYRYPTSP
jgi:hypothetical protein